MIFRIGSAIATLGKSEVGYIVGGAGYDMHDYVEKGGDSALEGFRRAGDKATKEYLTGWGAEIGLGVLAKGLGASGSAVAGKLAEKYPGGYKAVTETVSGWADDVSKALTKPRSISGISAGADDAATGLGKTATGSKAAGRLTMPPRVQEKPLGGPTMPPRAGPRANPGARDSRTRPRRGPRPRRRPP